jgi:hypothetical protein
MLPIPTNAGIIDKANPLYDKAGQGRLLKDGWPEPIAGAYLKAGELYLVSTGLNRITCKTGDRPVLTRGAGQHRATTDIEDRTLHVRTRRDLR